MLNSRYYVLLPLTLCLGITIGFVGHKSPDSSLFFFTSIIMFTVALPSRLIFQRRKIFGYIHYAACCVSLFSLLIMSWLTPGELPSFIHEEYITFPFVALSVLSLISVIIAVPTVIIPYFRRKRSYVTEPEDVSLKVDFVTKGFDKIRESFSDVQKAISRETSDIDLAITEFKKSLQRQGEDLKKLQLDLRKTKEELDEYKLLASLSKKQRDAFLAALSKHKYVDYFIGFVLGIASSALVQWSPTILNLLLKK